MLESKRRAMIFLLLAFILAVIAGYLVFDKVRSLNAELGGMTKIYVAAVDIPSRTLITENQVKTKEIPNRYVSKSNITDIKRLIGQVLVIPVSTDDIITDNMIKPVSNLRKEDDRLVAMYRSDKIQFDQVVTDMDRVDIIVSTEENGQKKTELFMKDVPVVWAKGKEEDFVGAALEVTSEDAPKLIYMQNFAKNIRVLKANVGKGDIPVVQEKVTTENNTESVPQSNTKKEGNTTNNPVKGKQAESKKKVENTSKVENEKTDKK